MAKICKFSQDDFKTFLQVYDELVDSLEIKEDAKQEYIFVSFVAFAGFEAGERGELRKMRDYQLALKVFLEGYRQCGGGDGIVEEIALWAKARISS